MKLFILLFAITLISVSSIFTQEVKLSNNFGAGYAGEEFYLTYIPTFRADTFSEDSIAFCFISEYDTEVSLKNSSFVYDKVVKIKKDIPNIVRVPVSKIVPYTKAKTFEPHEEQIYKKAALYIKANDPVECYSYLKGKDKSEGFKIIPVQSLGMKYYVTSSRNVDPTNTQNINTSYTAIVATKDKTKIEIILGGEKSNQTPLGKLNGDLIKVILDKDDVYLLPVINNLSDLSGTEIISDQPISVISGNYYTHLPINENLGNFTIEQDIPVEVLGKNFHITPFSKGLHQISAKIVATEPGTIYSTNSMAEGQLNQPSGIVGVGFNYLNLPTTRNASFYTTNKPTYISMFEISADKATPFQISVIPSEQYRKDYKFYIPNDFDSRFINVVFRTPIKDSVPKDILIRNNTNNYTKLSEISYLHLDYISKDEKGEWYSAVYEIKGTGNYHIKSDNPIAVYIYGYTPLSSFGYNAGGNLKPTQYFVDTLAPKIETTFNDKGVDGKVFDDDKDLIKNTSGFNSFYVFDQLSHNTTFSLNSFLPRTYQKTNWSVKVKDLDSLARAYILFFDYAGNQKIFDYQYKPLDKRSPSMKYTKNLFGEANCKAWDQSAAKVSTIKNGIASIELNVEKSYNYSLKLPDFVKGSLDTITFSLSPLLFEKDAKAVIIIKDTLGNSAEFTIEHKPERDKPVITFENISDEAKKLKVKDFPDNEAIRGNLTKFNLVTEKSENINFEILDFKEGAREATAIISKENFDIPAKAYVYVSDIFGNDSTYFYDFPMTSINDQILNEITLVPSPVVDILFVEGDISFIESYIIYDLKGAIVLQSETVVNREINLKNLPYGTYFIELKTNLGVVSKQFIKE